MEGNEGDAGVQKNVLEEARVEEQLLQEQVEGNNIIVFVKYLQMLAG